MDVEYLPGALVNVFYKDVAMKLRSEGHAVSASRMVLWRVSHDDLKPLQRRALVEPHFVPALDKEMMLFSGDKIAAFAPSDAIWTQLLSGGAGAWGAAGCSPWGGALTSRVCGPCVPRCPPAAHRAHALPSPALPARCRRCACAPHDCRRARRAGDDDRGDRRQCCPQR